MRRPAVPCRIPRLRPFRARSALPVATALLATVLLAACGGDAPETDDEAAPVRPPPGPPPATDIWLGELTIEGDSARVSGLRNVTDRPGYDNQPTFTPDGGAFLYTVVDDAGQADTWRYDFREDRAVRVTETAPESEYSPTPIPGSDAFSAVRVEADSTQRLWRFPTERGGQAVLFPNLAPVGYHAWADEESVVMYVLGEPSTLVVAGGETSEIRELARDVGRSIQAIPGEAAVSFVQHISATEATDTANTTDVTDATDTAEADAAGAAGTRIMRWSRADGVTPVTDALDGGDYHAWTPGGLLLMGSGSEIRAWREGWDEWRTVGTIPGSGTVSRMAVSPDGARIAVVVESSEGG